MIDFGFFNHDYPYTNFHELNLDWILRQMIELRSDMKNFVNQNTIKYADPIQWNITAQYEGNTVVIEPNSGNAYISSQPVPAGVPISNTDYWSVIGNFSVLYESIKESIAAADDDSNINATEARTEGQLLWLNSKLYKVLSDISVGALYITSGTGQNLQEVTIEELLNKETEDRIESVENLGNVLISSIMAIQGNIPKDVNLIKPESFGAVADGVTDDTQAFNDCLDYAGEHGKYVMLTGRYNIEGVVYLKSGVNIYGNNAKIYYKYTNPDRPLDRLKCFAFNATDKEDISIEGISFYGLGGQTTTYYTSICIGGHNSNNIHVYKCRFYGEHGLAAVQFDDSDFITVISCLINEYSYAGVAFTEGTSNVDVSYNVILNGVYAGGELNRYAISLCGYYNYPAAKIGDHLVATNNIIKDTVGLWEGIDAHGGKNIIIANNTITGIPQPIAIFSQSSRGFYVTNAHIYDNYCVADELHAHSDALIRSNTQNAFTFSGSSFDIHDNHFYANLASSTNLLGVGLGGSDVSFRNNYLNNLGRYCLSIGGEYGFSGGIIKGNHLTQNITNTSLIFIWRVNTPNLYIIFEDNDIIARKFLSVDSSINVSNCYVWTNHNIYRNIVPTTDYTGLYPDFATPSTINSCAGIAGQIAWNLSPSAGGVIGWVCTSGGNPGTWKGFGTIAN